MFKITEIEVAELPSKIVQIAFPHEHGALHLLCEDGSVWVQYRENHYKRRVPPYKAKDSEVKVRKLDG